MTLATRPFDVDAARSHFPALERVTNGRPAAYLDGPAGTQVPRECIDAIAAYLERGGANSHGRFEQSRETDALWLEAHAASAAFLGADDPGEIILGPNMTTLTFALSRGMGRLLRPGDEIVVTRLDHDANVAPWLALQQERDVTIRWIEIDGNDCTLDLSRFEDLLSDRTRLVAVGLASNAVGTLNPVARMADAVHAAGAWLFVDAVHAAPHLPIDVRALGADFVACSPYKFYGPHLGMIWGRRELLDAIPAVKVRPSSDDLPGRFETGTPPYEVLAGLLGTYRYLEQLGVDAGAPGDPGTSERRRERLHAALEAMRGYERSLTPLLLDGLASVPGVRVWGITDASRLEERVPTVAFTMERHSPADIAQHLGERAIATWDGDYYAYELIRALGLAESGGMVRVGLVHYNTAAEVERLVDALRELS